MNTEYSKKIVSSIGCTLLGALFGLLIAWPLMWAWNYVIPYVFELKQITWGQAWCLHFISGLLIKSTLITVK
jgi:hypothetical protein